MSSDDALRGMLRQAEALVQAGQLGAAEATYRAVLGLRPRLPNTWYNLARLQRRLGQPATALESYAQALRHGVGQPEEVHLNRSVIYADDLREPQAAERELLAALRRNPRYAPALLNLGNLHADLGHRDEARRAYQKLLVLEPRHWEALARLAELEPVRGPDDPLIARLRDALAHGARAPGDRAALGFALGRTLDAAGDYDAAFEAYVAANRDGRAAAPPGLPPYERARQEALVDALIAAFSPEWVRTHASDCTAEPIFVCGMFRSGSTLAEQILASHPRVTSGGELDTLPRLAATDLRPFPASLAGLDAARLADLATKYRDELRRRFPAADRVTDKRPDNFLLVGLIKALFPRARIVHTTREPLDNCLSVFFLRVDPRVAYAGDLGDIGHYYGQYRRLMAHWRSLYGDSILDFDYDAMVRAPREATARLLDYCGLAWDERCLEFHRAETAVKTASVWQVREPLYARSSGRWRHYERQLAPLTAALGPAVLRE